MKWVKETSQYNEDFIKSKNEESDEGYLVKVDVQYSEKLNELHNDYPFFLPERIKIYKVEKLLANLHDKIEYVIHIRNLKQALNHGLVLKKVCKVTNDTINSFELFVEKRQFSNQNSQWLNNIIYH